MYRSRISGHTQIECRKYRYGISHGLTSCPPIAEYPVTAYSPCAGALILPNPVDEAAVRFSRLVAFSQLRAQQLNMTISSLQNNDLLSFFRFCDRRPLLFITIKSRLVSVSACFYLNCFSYYGIINRYYLAGELSLLPFFHLMYFPMRGNAAFINFSLHQNEK